MCSKTLAWYRALLIVHHRLYSCSICCNSYCWQCSLVEFKMTICVRLMACHGIWSWSTWSSLNRLRLGESRERTMSGHDQNMETRWWLWGDRLCLILWHVGMPPIRLHGTDLAISQSLPVSTVPDTGRSLSNSNYRGLDEEEGIWSITKCQDTDFLHFIKYTKYIQIVIFHQRKKLRCE